MEQGSSKCYDKVSSCFIHRTNIVDTELSNLTSEKTWNTLRNASQIRRFTPILELKLEPGQTFPCMSYHRKCYQIYTMTSEFEKNNEKE